MDERKVTNLIDLYINLYVNNRISHEMYMYLFYKTIGDYIG